MSTIKVTDIGPARARIDAGGVAIAACGAMCGFLIWLVSARYTVDGTLALANALLAFFHAPFRLAIPPAFPLYLVLSPVPALMTYAEWQRQPFSRAGGTWRFDPPQHWVVWSAVLLADGYTTFVGLGVPPGPAAPAALRDLADAFGWRAAAAAVCTAGPEWIWRWTRWQLRRSLGAA